MRNAFVGPNKSYGLWIMDYGFTASNYHSMKIWRAGVDDGIDLAIRAASYLAFLFFQLLVSIRFLALLYLDFPQLPNSFKISPSKYSSYPSTSSAREAQAVLPIYCSSGRSTHQYALARALYIE